MKKIFLFVSVFAIIAISCSNDDDNTEPVNQNPVSIAKGRLSANGTLTNLNMVITHNEDWQVLMSNMDAVNDNITDTFEETTIDFNTYQIIAVFQAKNSTTSVDITNVSETDNTIVVTVENLQLGITQDIAHPFHIIKIPKSDKLVVFE